MPDTELVTCSRVGFSCKDGASLRDQMWGTDEDLKVLFTTHAGMDA